ncbi:hypothetical protein GCM10011609_65460 [Lentzea pudingi]|uniref:HTTM-like domain-containing protein n=1 Tax=Lentzea pudingi TaxID=1789439 RepID=A0ABQ2IN44_9PSEU|nr:sporulation-delaying protein SdpB family protein [Lentzea pudingi]GGN15732.1 hypothetical protein GCM10011609_65460 [Lentzea pudingi]
MRELSRSLLIHRLKWTIANCEPRGTAFAIGRTLLAIASLANLLANQDSTLFSAAEAPACAGLRNVSLWCLAGPTENGLLSSRIIAVVVLVVTASGYRPRWTCVPHWYVAFSLAASASISNGGDRTAHIAALLLIPICLGDGRRWQWQPATGPLSPEWRGRAFAALLVLRLQIFVIYVTALAAKLGDPLWRQGSAMYVVAHDRHYGVPEQMRILVEPGLNSFPAVAVATWTVIAVQAVLALAILVGAKARKVVLLLGLSLHAGIGLLMNLPAFGLAMAGLLVIGTATLGPGHGQDGLRTNARPVNLRKRERPALSASPRP